MIVYHQELHKNSIFCMPDGLEYVEVTLSVQRNLSGTPRIVECAPRMVSASTVRVFSNDTVVVKIGSLGDAIAQTENLPRTCIMEIVK